jgi:hypothetical protein
MPTTRLAFNKLELYPTPKPNERVNQQTLNDIQNYMTNTAKSTLGQKYRVVTTPASRKGLETVDHARGDHRGER